MDENRQNPELEAEDAIQAASCATDADLDALARQRYPNKPWLEKHAFPVGTSGNPKGRPSKANGAKVDRRTLMRQAFEMGSQDVIAKLLEMAKGGDIKAIDIAMKYTMAPAKAESGLLELDLPPDATIEDRLQAITDAMTSGQISPESAALASRAVRDQVEAAKICAAQRGIEDLQNKLKAMNGKGRSL